MFVFDVRSPTVAHPIESAPTCRQGNSWAWADAAGAAVSLAMVAFVIASDFGDKTNPVYDTPEESATAVGLFGVAGLGFGAGTWYGLSSARSCREARASHEEWAAAEWMAAERAAAEWAARDLPSTAAEAVTVWDTSLSLHTDEYERKTVRLGLHFENKTGRRVVGVLTKVRIENVFGRLLHMQTYENVVVLDPGERQRNDTFRVFEDNPFIAGQTYDKLWPSAQKGTASIKVEVRKVIFEDGEILKNPPPRSGTPE